MEPFPTLRAGQLMDLLHFKYLGYASRGRATQPRLVGRLALLEGPSQAGILL